MRRLAMAEVSALSWAWWRRGSGAHATTEQIGGRCVGGVKRREVGRCWRLSSEGVACS